MKQHTVIFVPHARARFRKWRFTTRQAILLVSLLTLLSLGGAFATFSYFTRAVDPEELQSLQQENSALREINDGFERSIRELEDQLADYQQRIHKLAIVAGVAELSPASDAGIGGSASVEDLGRLTTEIGSLRTQVQQMGPHMDLLQKKLGEQRLMISSTPAVSPVKGLLTSGFGYRRDPFTRRRAFHNGIDIVAAPGKEVRATGDGIVVQAGRSGPLGRAIFVSHGFGITTRYGHLSKALVEPGQQVRRGQVIGRVGSTGRSTGYHLHYEVRVESRPVNPLGYILDGTSP